MAERLDELEQNLLGSDDSLGNFIHNTEEGQAIGSKFGIAIDGSLNNEPPPIPATPISDDDNSTVSPLPISATSISDVDSGTVLPPLSNREMLTEFYEEVDPSKVGDVDKILEVFSVDELIDAMTEKYGRSPPFQGDPKN